jgi:hypothetical protein
MSNASQTRACAECGGTFAVNKDGALRKHTCTSVLPEQTANPGEVLPELPELAYPGDAVPLEPVADEPEADFVIEPGQTPVFTTEAPAAEVLITERRYCAVPNCGKRPHRHEFCANHHATHCRHGRE